MSVSSCPIKGISIGIGSVADEPLNSFFPTVFCSMFQCSFIAVTSPSIDVHSLRDEKLQDGYLSLCSCQMKANGIGIGSIADKPLHSFFMTMLCSIFQCSFVEGTLSIDVHSLRDQKLQGGYMAVTSCPIEGSIKVIGSIADEPLHSFFLTMFCSIFQCSFVEVTSLSIYVNSLRDQKLQDRYLSFPSCLMYR